MVPPQFINEVKTKKKSYRNSIVDTFTHSVWFSECEGTISRLLAQFCSELSKSEEKTFNVDHMEKITGLQFFTDKMVYRKIQQ